MSDQDDQSRPLSDTNAQSQQSARQPQQGGIQQQGGGERGGHRHGRRRSGNQMPSPNEPRRQESNVNSSVNMTELRDLVELIAMHGFTDFELEREGFRVRLRREQFQQAAPIQSAATSMASSSLNQDSVMPSSAPIQTTSPVSPSASTSPPSATAASPETAAVADDADLHMITSPIVGTFYRSPSPTAEQFVRIGSTVESDTVVCIVEAMKLMNEILAETSGTIEKIYVENAQPVEYGQPLFGVRK